MNKNESTTLNIARFVMTWAVIFLHGYTSVQMYPDIMAMPGYRAITKVFGLQFGDVGVPAFFAISGYLFFYGYEQTLVSYLSKLKRRFHSLLIPYLFWNALFLVVFYIAEFIPSVRGLFNEGRGLVQDYTLTDYLRAFWSEERTSAPLLNQLWFVRNLMVLMAFSPLIYYLIKRFRSFGIFIMAVMWYFGAELYYLANTLFFFFLGAWFSINGKSFVESVNQYRKLIIISFLLLASFDLVFMYYPVSHWFHRGELLLGTPFALTVLSWMVEKGYAKNITFLSSSSFFVYVIHDPMLRFIRKFSLCYLDHNSEVQMIFAYFSSIAIDLLIAYLVYWLLSKYVPKFLSIVSGGRA